MISPVTLTLRSRNKVYDENDSVPWSAAVDVFARRSDGDYAALQALVPMTETRNMGIALRRPLSPQYDPESERLHLSVLPLRIGQVEIPFAIINEPDKRNEHIIKSVRIVSPFYPFPWDMPLSNSAPDIPYYRIERQDMCHNLHRQITTGAPPKVVLLHGANCSGKTTLLRQLHDVLVRDGYIAAVVDLPVQTLLTAKTEGDCRKIVYNSLWTELHKKYGGDTWTLDNSNAAAGMAALKLHSAIDYFVPHTQGKRVVIVVDEVDRIAMHGDLPIPNTPRHSVDVADLLRIVVQELLIGVLKAKGISATVLVADWNNELSERWSAIRTDLGEHDLTGLIEPFVVGDFTPENVKDLMYQLIDDVKPKPGHRNVRSVARQIAEASGGNPLITVALLDYFWARWLTQFDRGYPEFPEIGAINFGGALQYETVRLACWHLVGRASNLPKSQRLRRDEMTLLMRIAQESGLETDDSWERNNLAARGLIFVDANHAYMRSPILRDYLRRYYQEDSREHA